MPQWITRDSPHGPVQAWQAIPMQPARGAVLVVQEIFGANAHVRDVANRLADAGYLALAPAMFDPVHADADLPYTDDALARGREYASALGFDAAVAILAACALPLRDAGHAVAAIGFCWGGSVAYLANTRLGLPASSWYGARTVPFLHEPLQAPMQPR